MARKRWVYRPGHPKASDLGWVDVEDLGHEPEPEKRALDAPIMAGRFYENVAATDGTDIGSRRKHQEYMKRNNLTITSDFDGSHAPNGEGYWQREQKKRDDFYSGRSAEHARDVREDVGRAAYEIFDRRRK